MKSKIPGVDKQYYENAWGQWEDMKSYGPSSRHVRRLVRKMIRGLKFKSILDAGCGSGSLLEDIHREFPEVDLNGIELADSGVRMAQQRNPTASIQQHDLKIRALDRKFDLVTCVDVLEHISDDLTAMENLYKMTAKFLLVVVPTGPLFEQERINVGHVHGYSPTEVNDKLKKIGFQIVKSMSWGFPFYNLYRRFVMNMPEETISGKFDIKKRIISELVYWLLFLNLPFGGERYYVLCKVEDAD